MSSICAGEWTAPHAFRFLRAFNLRTGTPVCNFKRIRLWSAESCSDIYALYNIGKREDPIRERERDERKRKRDKTRLRFPRLKNQWAKYLEVASYILLSLYSFSDWLSEEAEADGVRQTTSLDESNDELESLHTVTVNPSKRLVGCESSLCGEKRKL